MSGLSVVGPCEAGRLRDSGFELQGARWHRAAITAVPKEVYPFGVPENERCSLLEYSWGIPLFRF